MTSCVISWWSEIILGSVSFMSFTSLYFANKSNKKELKQTKGFSKLPKNISINTLTGSYNLAVTKTWTP